MKWEVRQGSCESAEPIRGIPGSEFEPRCPLRVAAKSATLRFQAVPFRASLKAAHCSLASPFRTEPAALGFDPDVDMPPSRIMFCSMDTN